MLFDYHAFVHGTIAAQQRWDLHTCFTHTCFAQTASVDMPSGSEYLCSCTVQCTERCIRAPKINIYDVPFAPVQYGPIRNRIVPNVQSPSVAPYSPPHDQDDDIGGAPSRDTVHDVHLPAVIVARKMLRDDMAALTATLKTECEVLQPWICLEEAHLEKERSAFFAKRDLRTGRISRHISVQESLDVVFAKILAAEAKAAEAAHTADEAAGPSGVEAATPAAPLQGASSSSSHFKVPAAPASPEVQSQMVQSWKQDHQRPVSEHLQRFRAGFRAPAPEVHSQMVQSQMVQRFIEGKADGSEPKADDMQLKVNAADDRLFELLRQNEDIARQTTFWSTALQESIARALRESQLRESQGEAARTIARQDDSLLKLLHENEETALQMTHLSRGLWDSLKPHVRSNERRRDTGSNVESL